MDVHGQRLIADVALHERAAVEVQIARRLGRTEAAVRRRAWRLRAARLVAADPLAESDVAGVQ